MSNKKHQSLQSALVSVLNTLKPWRTKVYLGLFLFFLASVLASVIPFLYGRITDIILTDRNLNLAYLLLFIWLVISLFSSYIRYRAGRLMDEISTQSANYFMTDLFGYLLTLPMNFHKEKKMGSIARRVSNGGDRGIYDFVSRILFHFFPQLITLLVSICILFLVEWRLSLVLIIYAAVYVFVTILFTNRVSAYQKKMQRAWEKSYGLLYDALGNIHDVKLVHNESYEQKRISATFRKSSRLEIWWHALWQKLGVWQSALTDINFVAIFAFGAIFLFQGQLTPGKLIMFIGYANLMVRPLTELASYYRLAKQATENINRATALRQLKPEDASGRALALKGQVEFKNVTFSYPKSQQSILNNITFTARAGEVVALVGKSGVGKTTLVDLIGKYYLPQSGSVKIDGFNLKDISLSSLRRQLAVVPQEISLFNDTILNNIRYARPDAVFADIVAAAKIANADEFISKFSKRYRQIVGERGIKLSTGQKQRLAIARAVLREPKILILDEATSALDSESERLVQEALARLIKGRTTFVIAHRLSTIQNADKIIVLEKGKIVELGAHRELMKNPRGIYRNFWELQTARQSI